MFDGQMSEPAVERPDYRLVGEALENNNESEEVVTQPKCSPGICHCRAQEDEWPLCGKATPLDYPGLDDGHPCSLAEGHVGPCFAVVPRV